MSNFIKKTLNPKTKKYEQAIWIDNYFGERKYGVKFSTGILRESKLLKQIKTRCNNN